MQETAIKIMFICVGLLVLSIIILGLQKAGIFHGITGSYFFDFVHNLQNANQTY